MFFKFQFFFLFQSGLLAFYGFNFSLILINYNNPGNMHPWGILLIFFTVNKAQRHYHSDKMWCLKGPIFLSWKCFDISQNQVSRYSINEDLLYMPTVYFSCFEKPRPQKACTLHNLYQLYICIFYYTCADNHFRQFTGIKPIHNPWRLHYVLTIRMQRLPHIDK